MFVVVVVAFRFPLFVREPLAVGFGVVVTYAGRMVGPMVSWLELIATAFDRQ